MLTINKAGILPKAKTTVPDVFLHFVCSKKEVLIDIEIHGISGI